MSPTEGETPSAKIPLRGYVDAGLLAQQQEMDRRFATSRREHDEALRALTTLLSEKDALERERITSVRNDLDGKIAANMREFTAVHRASEKAVDKAEQAQLRVNTGQNEFRQALADQAASLMPRREVEALLREQTRQLGELRDALAALRTSVALGPPSLQGLQRTADRREGRDEGTVSARTLLFSVLGSLLVVGSILSPHIH